MRRKITRPTFSYLYSCLCRENRYVATLFTEFRVIDERRRKSTIASNGLPFSILLKIWISVEHHVDIRMQLKLRQFCEIQFYVLSEIRNVLTSHSNTHRKCAWYTSCRVHWQLWTHNLSSLHCTVVVGVELNVRCSDEIYNFVCFTAPIYTLVSSLLSRQSFYPGVHVSRDHR